VVVYLPWYGGKSAQSRDYFDRKRHPEWTSIGIDIFNTKEEFNNILAYAVVSQYAYALVMRMMAEQVHLEHEAGRRVGLVGISYGANVLSAYTTKGLELPDALVAVEGGSILQTTLKGTYRGHNCDPQTLRALREEPDFIPVQKPVDGKAARISAAVINLDDKIVIGQEELWKNAAEKMHIRGGHLLGPRLYRGRIRRFVDEHLERLLVPQDTL
jgi:dienelactone hydrolase